MIFVPSGVPTESTGMEESMDDIGPKIYDHSFHVRQSALNILDEKMDKDAMNPVEEGDEGLLTEPAVDEPVTQLLSRSKWDKWINPSKTT